MSEVYGVHLLPSPPPSKRKPLNGCVLFHFLQQLMQRMIQDTLHTRFPKQQQESKLPRFLKYFLHRVALVLVVIVRKLTLPG